VNSQGTVSEQSGNIQGTSSSKGTSSSNEQQNLRQQSWINVVTIYIEAAAIDVAVNDILVTVF